LVEQGKECKVTQVQSSLISIAKLSELQLNANCILLDASIPPIGIAPEKIAKDTIPGSLVFDIEKDFSDHSSGLPHTLINASEFETKARALGINKDSIIIVFDAYGVYSSPRAWWMFKIMGHEKVFLLNGGLPAWKQAGFATTESFAKPTTIGNFVADFRADYLVDKTQIAAQITQPKMTIVDARSADRFYGSGSRWIFKAGNRKRNISQCINKKFHLQLRLRHHCLRHTTRRS
jgi:thiosulfate/3-mercaptopyruvate sulfurtransferase